MVVNQFHCTLIHYRTLYTKQIICTVIIGANCRFSSVHLARDGLYVILKRYMFSLPNSMKEFDKIAKDLMMLITFKVRKK